ncbi:MAG: protein phosphatase 2C domain-containing protein [Pirellulaceae bacterium]|nr:protein phosphatase 2C domain-containing protein [Pirellulaceae bacterium]
MNSSDERLRDTDEHARAAQEQSTVPRASRFLIPEPEPVVVRYGAATHVGQVRTRNEDHFAVVRRKRSREILATNVPLQDVEMADDEAYVLIVADGVGGEGFGDLASQLAIRAGWESASRAASWLMRRDDLREGEIERQVATVARAIQQAFLTHSRDNPRLAGMATTWTCAYIIGYDAIVAHVGDSRAYHCHDGRALQITRDHTLAEEMRQSGLPPDQSRKFRSVLTRAFGGEAEEVVPDIYELQLADGDAVLLCSDGLSNLLSDVELAQWAQVHGDPQVLCDELLRQALDRGAPDNVTVVVARVFAQPGSGHYRG